MEVKIKPDNCIMFGGQPLILNKAQVNFYIKEGYIKHKEGSENGEMEYTKKYIVSSNINEKRN